MTKLLITAGRGFIARNLYEELGGEYEIAAPGRQELNLLDGEAVLEFLKRGRFDAVIHTATHDPAPKGSAKDPARVLENNLRMFFNVARGQAHFGKLLYFGSGAEFAREHWAPRMGEDYFDRHVPAEQYGLSKYIMTKFAERSDRIYNLRIFSVFGKYEDWRYRFISRACCCAVMGLPVVIKQDSAYDFLPVGDLARIVGWFVGHEPRQRVYNVCSAEPRRFSELAGLVASAAGKELQVKILDEGRSIEYSGDNSRLLAELKGFTFTPLSEAVKALYDWYSANRQLIKEEELI